MSSIQPNQCGCLDPKTVDQAYRDAGYDPNDPASRQKAEQDTYDKHKDEIDAYCQQHGMNPQDIIAGTANFCPKCRCHFFIHFYICSSVPTLPWMACYTHPGTYCSFGL